MTTKITHPIYGSVVALGPFTVANLDTALTNTDLVIGQTGMTLVPMLESGSVVGLAVNSSAAPSAGTATFSIHNASTELVGGPTAVIDSVTNTLHSEGKVSTAREHTFAQGARLGISATTTTNLAATTVDYNVTLYVRYDPD